MVSISSTTSVQSVAQVGLAEFRLQQATRDADQAEQVARSLQAEARIAQQNANDAQQNAREVSALADQAQVNAGKARQGVAQIRSAVESAAQSAPVAARTSETPDVPVPVASVLPLAPPVVNVFGQKTGTVINTTA